jgi:hypothetical protein
VAPVAPVAPVLPGRLPALLAVLLRPVPVARGLQAVRQTFSARPQQAVLQRQAVQRRASPAALVRAQQVQRQRAALPQPEQPAGRPVE